MELVLCVMSGCIFGVYIILGVSWDAINLWGFNVGWFDILLLLNLTSFLVVLSFFLQFVLVLSWSLDCILSFLLQRKSNNQCLLWGYALPCMLVHFLFCLIFIVNFLLLVQLVHLVSAAPYAVWILIWLCHLPWTAVNTQIRSLSFCDIYMSCYWDFCGPNLYCWICVTYH